MKVNVIGNGQTFVYWLVVKFEYGTVKRGPYVSRADVRAACKKIFGKTFASLEGARIEKLRVR